MPMLPRKSWRMCSWLRLICARQRRIDELLVGLCQLDEPPRLVLRDVGAVHLEESVLVSSKANAHLMVRVFLEIVGCRPVHLRTQPETGMEVGTVGTGDAPPDVALMYVCVEPVSIACLVELLDLHYRDHFMCVKQL